MGLKDLLRKKEALVAIDIGASGIKLLELDTTGGQPQLLNVAFTPFKQDVFTNNLISKTEEVAEQIAAMIENNNIVAKRVVTAVPAPSVFAKKIKVPKADPAQLFTNIQFEAGNFIPHNIDAIKLDYHVLGPSGKNQYEVLVVAVKNEVIESFTNCFSIAGLDVAVIDIDYFAAQNMFELGYPELADKTIALINVGARYSSINICSRGGSLFTGDVSVGGRLFTDAVAQGLKISADEAEKLKRKEKSDDQQYALAREIIDRNVEYMAVELNRQLSFFWSASGAEQGIDQIVLTGGGAAIAGLGDELSEKTGVPCLMADPFKGIECGSSFDEGYLKEMRPLMSVAVGMGIREPGDRMEPAE